MIYDLLAPIYDEINKDISYSLWADFIEKIIKRDYKGDEGELVLDLGCGTGSMTLELARRGYDMTGVDRSVEMLETAREREAGMNNPKPILWLCQDMCDFELYGTVGVVVSCLDCVNHLTDTKSLLKCFDLVHNYLSPDGLFIFDVNGKGKFENVYADNSYVYETDGSVCVWQNNYNPRTKICDFYISVFAEGDDGRYDRYDELDKERMYTVKSLKKALVDTGFLPIGFYSDFEFNNATDMDDRIYVVAKCKKDG